MKLLFNVMQLLLLRLDVGLQNARPLLQLLLQLVHYAELRLLQLIHGRLRLLRRLRLLWLLLLRLRRHLLLLRLLGLLLRLLRLLLLHRQDFKKDI